MKDILGTCAYAFYVIMHPFDGFWDLKHHKKETFKAANILLALVCIVYVLRATLTGYLFNINKPEYVNVLGIIGSIVIPLSLWAVVNWALSTLFDGKATMKQIWIATIYALFPLVLLYIPGIILSHFITIEEAMFYSVLNTVAILWTVFLIIVGNLVIQDYTMGKTLLMAFFTLLGIVGVLFIGVVIFSALQQLVSFVTTVYLELKYKS